ncbi:hypothetical protein NEOLEDRAFT_1139380 [Neolentinus lepideus HHB14362 ss-1]|uniref:Uncharacterized protein n=1 Tax=Neolentinus lepideus HHB14362 ss-1 TaxID=1314782 RepID=A0A165PU79_9AGAM|nr:hypothetical protein NEOLEDRAFT_1139380 [Neolentinus lepideus HHB14362 ss-1]
MTTGLVSAFICFNNARNILPREAPARLTARLAPAHPSRCSDWSDDGIASKFAIGRLRYAGKVARPVW